MYSVIYDSGSVPRRNIFSLRETSSRQPTLSLSRRALTERRRIACPTDIDILLLNNQRQLRTLHIQKNVLPYALCWLLCPVSAALASFFRMDLISTSYKALQSGHSHNDTNARRGRHQKEAGVKKMLHDPAKKKLTVRKTPHDGKNLGWSSTGVPRP